MPPAWPRGANGALLYEITMDVYVQDVGATPSGRRRIVVVKNGSFSGPRLRGRVLPCGGDWLLERADGSRRLDVRITLETHDGALIYASYLGVIHGSATDVSTHYFRTGRLFETAAEQYDWLNHILAVGYGRRAGSQVGYTVHMIGETFKDSVAIPRARTAVARRPEVRLELDHGRRDEVLQVMECDDRPLLSEWMAACRDLIDFEVVSVITSAEAAEGVAPRL